MAKMVTEKPEGKKRNYPLIDRAGQRYGKLVIVSLAKRDSGKWANHYWNCRCDCGSEKVIGFHSLKSGSTSSCGCVLHDWLVQKNTTHGLSRSYPREYRIWKNMRARCFREANKSYPDYGGRGISVCAEWSDFAAFMRDMGPAPDRSSLDRIDVNGDYTAGNCRWATSQEQARNKRTNHVIEYGGERKTLQEWCNQFGLEPSKVRYRIKVGWSLDDVFSPGDGRKSGRAA